MGKQCQTNFWGSKITADGDCSHEIKRRLLLTHLLLPLVFLSIRVFSNELAPWASLVAQEVKNLPAMQETWVQSLGREDPLEEGMATHSSILA